LIEVDGLDVALTNETFNAYCELARALLATDSGRARIDRMSICRLRRAIDEQTGQENLGKSLIRYVSKSHYMLAIDRKALAVRRSFRELRGSH
jgi:hypothetical protein